MRRFLGIWLLIAVAAGFLAGCRPPQEVIGGQERPFRISRVVSLAPGATELVLVRGQGLQLVGRTESCDWPRVEERAQVVMKGVRPNFELIQALEPDLVIYDADLTSPTDIEKFRELGIRTFALEGDTVDDYIANLYRYGSLTGNETNINNHVNEEILSALDRAAASAPPSPVKVAVVLPGTAAEHLIAGTESRVADLVRRVGGTPVGPKGNQFVPMSVETLVAENPDVIVVPGSAAEAERLARDPRLAGIRAMTNRMTQGPAAGKPRVFALNPDVVLRRGARTHLAVQGFDQIVKRLAFVP